VDYDASNDAIASTRYSSAERQWISETHPENRLRRFYRIWVIREALVKATGEGLGHEARDGVIEIVEDVPVLSGGEWRASEHLLLDDVAAAVVVPRQQSVVWNEISWEALSARSA
jgi:phosphopantetheinyl transferase